MNTDKLNEYPNSKENEKDLANKILDFYDRYDPYWSFGTANDDLASTIMQLKNSDTRQKLIDNLQRIIATEKKAPCMSSNSFISLAEQLKNEITNYGMEILDTSKKNIMEENTTENQSNIYNQEENLFNGFSEDEINLAQKLFNFESNYDPYGFADKIAEQGDLNYLANEVHSLRNENERQDIINYLQEIIDNADKEPLISTEHVVSCAKQLMEDIAVYYDREIIDTTKTNIMEENTMENQSTAKFFNKHSYGEIENKAFLSCDAKTAYEIGQKAQEQGVTFSAKYDGDKSAVVVDGVKDKAFVDEVKAEFKVHTPDEPTFFNSKAYKDIENKAFLNTDAKTAYAIGQKAQEQGVTFSTKFDGNKSVVVVDGMKDKTFVDAVKTEFTSKVHTADEPTFFNKKAYKDIENKFFFNTDAKTAYAIGQKAQEQGVIFSAKFDGAKSAVTVDGVKDKAFVNEVRAEFNLSDKLDEVENVTEKIADALDSGEIDIERDTQSIDNQAR